MFRYIISIFLASFLLSACSRSAPDPQGTPGLPESEETWTIKMNQSGGFVGLSRSIEISSDGKFAVTDDRTDKTVEGQIASSELTKLRQLVSTAKFTTIPKSEETGCADCFIYNLEIQDIGKPITVQLDDVTLPDSELESLVTLLRDIMDKSLT